MQACDLIAHFPPATTAAEAPKPAAPPATTRRTTTRDQKNRHEPPLRYEVESMQHWLDLNA